MQISLRDQLLVLWVVGLAGCAQNPFTAPTQAHVQQQTQLAQQTQQIEQRAAALDRDNQQLSSMLAQSRQQTKVLEDQLVAMRDQLASTTDQLAQLRDEKSLTDRRAEALVATTRQRAGAVITANNSFQQALPAVNMPGVEVRRDGDLIRVELSADRLFDQGAAQLRPDAGPLLEAVAAEIARTYGDRPIAVEGHTDLDPASGGNPHQVSVVRAALVYEYLVARTRLRANQLSVAGHGANQPVVSNATPSGRQRNRRVELVIYPGQAQPR